jgi:hypothetical protein
LLRYQINKTCFLQVTFCFDFAISTDIVICIDTLASNSRKFDIHAHALPETIPDFEKVSMQLDIMMLHIIGS